MDTVTGPNRTPEEQFTQLVSVHQLALLRLCYAYLQDRSLAEDAVQETFLKAYRSMDQFRGDASAKTWLSRIAINTCRDMRKSAWFRLVNRAVTPDMLPEPAVQPSEEDTEITLTVMKLPLRLRECVLLYYFENMTTTEVAETLHISQQAVSGRLMRARSKLRTALEGSERDGE
ncbi:MAG: sigma-70 family RNA polymerase sigma factor [Clostridia bacterium]|nr:sigma-70 family RNA polymerase sigma factor [Clostridia bacterium]